MKNCILLSCIVLSLAGCPGRQVDRAVTVSFKNLKLVGGSWRDYGIAPEREVVTIRVDPEANSVARLQIYPVVLDAKIGHCKAELVVPKGVNLVGSRHIVIRTKPR